MEAAPLAGVFSDSMEKTVPSVSPSTSVAARVPVIAPLFSSPVPEVSPVMTAGSSMAVMVKVMSWVVMPSQSSVTVTVKESEPLKLAVGV